MGVFRRAFMDRDIPVLAVQHQVGRAISNRACTRPTVVVVHDFNPREIRVHLSALAARVEFESHLVRNAYVDVTVSIIDLNIARRLELDLDRAVLVLNARISGHRLQSDVFRARAHVQGPSHVVGAQAVGIEI